MLPVGHFISDDIVNIKKCMFSASLHLMTRFKWKLLNGVTWCECQHRGTYFIILIFYLTLIFFFFHFYLFCFVLPRFRFGKFHKTILSFSTHWRDLHQDVNLVELNWIFKKWFHSFSFAQKVVVCSQVHSAEQGHGFFLLFGNSRDRGLVSETSSEMQPTEFTELTQSTTNIAIISHEIALGRCQPMSRSTQAWQISTFTLHFSILFKPFAIRFSSMNTQLSIGPLSRACSPFCQRKEKNCGETKKKRRRNRQCAVWNEKMKMRPMKMVGFSVYSAGGFILIYFRVYFNRSSDNIWFIFSVLSWFSALGNINLSTASHHISARFHSFFINSKRKFNEIVVFSESESLKFDSIPVELGISTGFCFVSKRYFFWQILDSTHL